MDGAPVGRRRGGQANWLAAGREPLVRLGDSSAAKTTRMGDSDSVRFSDGEYIEGRPSTRGTARSLHSKTPISPRATFSGT